MYSLLNKSNIILEARSRGGDDGGMNIDNDPFLDFELNFNFGLNFKEKFRILGIGGGLEIAPLAVDLMNLKWDSNSNKFKYTPWSSAYSSFGAAYAIFSTLNKYDYEKRRYNVGGALAFHSYDKDSGYRISLIDSGSAFFFGVNIKITMSPRKFMNEYSKQHLEWNRSIGYSMWSLMH